LRTGNDEAMVQAPTYVQLHKYKASAPVTVPATGP